VPIFPFQQAPSRLTLPTMLGPLPVSI